jgi:2-dehydro-3-deoxygalactonokinase
MSSYLIGCDWGTTGFRLRLTNTVSGAVVAEYKNLKGVAAINRDYLQNIQVESISDSVERRRNYFLKIVESSILELEHRSGLKLRDTPVIISGMASSSIGMEQLDYAPVPFLLEGSQSIVKLISGEIDNPVYLISGIATESDVMRGEETQLIGLWQLLKEKITSGDQLFILPGTHSKHIHVRDGYIINFRTYMTGELFDIVSKFSVLQYSVATAAAPFIANAFEQGFRDAQSVSVLNALFHVRTNQIFQKLSPEENRSYLSGVVIGSEFQAMENFGGQILLATSPELHDQYSQAMKIFGRSDWSVLDAQLIESSAFTGHSVIFNHLKQCNFS